ncbi:MAG: 50S ribosomal protein L17 [Candidatus Eisenbacteria bacterium]|nr:50S ribosomal protein L17 [Candidatus Eisenbacteria bacterium]
MRHRKDHRRLGRKSEHRRALLRNLVTALFQYERIETTVAKAKETRRFAERMITFGKKGDLAARREVAAYILKPEIVAKLFSTIAPWYTDRNGGYTRIVRIGRRLGDAGETAYLELVKSDEQKEQDRAAKQAIAEARALAASGEKPEKKKKAESKAEVEEAAAAEKPKRAKKKEAAGAGAGGGAKRRGGPRKVGGG